MTIHYGFIGFGNMAKAIVEGLKDQASLRFSYYSLSNRHNEIPAQASLAALVAHSQVLVFCIKPQELAGVLGQMQDLDLTGKVLVSPVAGISTQFIQHFFDQPVKLIRIMPNLAVAYQQSVTAFYATHSDALVDLVKGHLQQLGKLVDLNESDFDLFTAIFGSGPAFLLEILGAMKNKITELQGVPSHIIDDLLLALMLGTASYLEHNHHKQNLAELIQNITSKGGTTEAGLSSFRSQALGDAFGAVIDAAKNRSKAIGNIYSESLDLTPQ